MRRCVLTLICLLATPGWGRVLLRWTEPLIPPASTMGISEVVVSWGAEALIRNARKQGYRVFAEVPVGKAAEITQGTKKGNLAGIILSPGNG